MNSITIARKGQYTRALLELLAAHPDGLSAREAVERLKPRLNLSAYELAALPSGPERFEVNLRYETTTLNKAGWLAKSKGVWTITEEGSKALRTLPDPEAFYREAARLYQVWRKAQPDMIGTTEEPTAEDEPTARVTFEQAEEQAWAEVEQYLRGMPPFEFQDLVADLLRAMGYHVPWKASPGKDGGIDIVAYRDPLGTVTPRIKVQVKRHSANADVKDLRQFMAVLGDDDVGLFVTTSGFTRDARDEARQDRRKVTLVDLERFFDLWVEHYPRLDDAARRRFPLQPIYFLAPGN